MVDGGKALMVGEQLVTKGRQEVVWRVASIKHIRPIGKVVTLAEVDGTCKISVLAVDMAGRFRPAGVGGVAG